MVNQIAIIIPTYNEEKNIEKLIKKIRYSIGNVLIVVVDFATIDVSGVVVVVVRVVVVVDHGRIVVIVVVHS